MFISIPICSRNRADSLHQILDSLFSLANLQSGEWGVLVVDNDSLDHTTEVCRDFRQRFPEQFRFWVEKKHGKSNALNSRLCP